MIVIVGGVGEHSEITELAFDRKQQTAFFEPLDKPKYLRTCQYVVTNP